MRYAPMAHLQTDGAQVFSLWNNEGMTSRPKRPRDPAQLAKLIVDIATGQVEDRVRPPKNRARTQPRRRRIALPPCPDPAHEL